MKLTSVLIIAYNWNVHFARNDPFCHLRSHILAQNDQEDNLNRTSRRVYISAEFFHFSLEPRTTTHLEF